MPDQLIADAGDLKHWRTELPNIIDDLGLDPFERTLYAHYKKVCGAAGGTCEEGVRKTAEKTKMSTAKVSLVRRELARRGLITEHEQPKQDDQIKPQVYVKITDIWELNFFYYSFKEGRPNIANWTVTQLREWIASVYVVNADAARLPDKREHLGSKRKEGSERLPSKQKKEPVLRINHEGTGAAAEKTPPARPGKKIQFTFDERSRTTLEEMKGADLQPPPLSRTLSDLPDADKQASLIFGNGQAHAAGEQLIIRAGWGIRNHDHRLAAAIFLEASNLPIPRKKTDRDDWIGSIDTHLETYGLKALGDLYPRIVAQMRGDGLTVSRPGSVTNNMADYWAKNSNGGNGGPAPVFTAEKPDWMKD